MVQAEKQQAGQQELRRGLKHDLEGLAASQQVLLRRLGLTPSSKGGRADPEAECLVC